MIATKQNKDFRILIVDDIPKNIQVLGNILLKEEYQISYTQNGKEALSLINTNKFDLILLDIMMPVMDGYEVCRKLKENIETHDIPIIFLTAKVEKENLIKGFNLGAQDYITKPFNAEELLARVRTHLELKNKTEQLQAVNQILEKKVDERTAELKKANEQLSTLEKAKSEFLSIISHELRTPLNGIQGLASILENSISPTERTEYFKYLKEASDRLIRFSETALLITSLNVKEHTLNFAPVKARYIINDVIAKLKDEIENNKVEIVPQIEPENLEITIDFELINVCFLNILDNAIGFSPEDSRIIIKCYENKKSIIIDFIDEGTGFSKGSLNKLFEYFSSGDIMHSEGLGLALASVKLIMDAHKGKILIENLKEGGALVKLIFSK